MKLSAVRTANCVGYIYTSTTMSSQHTDKYKCCMADDKAVNICVKSMFLITSSFHLLIFIYCSFKKNVNVFTWLALGT